MPKIITLQILVNDLEHLALDEAIDDMMQQASTPVDKDSTGSWIQDWNIKDAHEVCSEVALSMKTKTYQEGSSFGLWVIQSPSLTKNGVSAHSQEIFWNPEFGWVTIDLATRYFLPTDADKNCALREQPDAKFIHLNNNKL